MECQKRTKKFHLIKKEIAQTIIKGNDGIYRIACVDLLKRFMGLSEPHVWVG